jgi:hypothetical protein
MAMMAGVGVLTLGVGAGLLAVFGMPVSLGSAPAGPPELQHVPQDAAVVAYADVRRMMSSDLRQKLAALAVAPKAPTPKEFEQRTGLNIEQDLDTVVVALVPSDPSTGADRGPQVVVLARGRFEASRLEALALQEGGTASDYRGIRVLTLKESQGPPAALAFLASDLVAFGPGPMVERAIAASLDRRNVLSNTEVMRLVAQHEGTHAWAVGRFDDLMSAARVDPAQTPATLPPVSWVSASGTLGTTIDGVVTAEARDEAAAAQLRDVVRGMLALGQLQSGNAAALSTLMQAFQLSGEGRTVALSFSLPTEALVAMAQQAAQTREARPAR